MIKQPPPTPPASYGPPQRLFPDADQPTFNLVLRLNFWALLPLTVGILLLWIPYQLYIVYGLNWVLFAEPNWGTMLTVFIYILVFIGSISLHELIHALFIRIFGYRPVLNIHWGFLTAGVPIGEFLRRNHYLAIAVAPLIIMTIFGGLILLFLPMALAQPILIALLFNFPASIGDLLIARRLLRHPADTLFASNENEIYIYHTRLN